MNNENKIYEWNQREKKRSENGGTYEMIPRWI
jgi:hypothetical protein